MKVFCIKMNGREWTDMKNSFSSEKSQFSTLLTVQFIKIHFWFRTIPFWEAYNTILLSYNFGLDPFWKINFEILDQPRLNVMKWIRTTITGDILYIGLNTNVSQIFKRRIIRSRLILNRRAHLVSWRLFDPVWQFDL